MLRLTSAECIRNVHVRNTAWRAAGAPRPGPDNEVQVVLWAQPDSGANGAFYALRGRLHHNGVAGGGITLVRVRPDAGGGAERTSRIELNAKANKVAELIARCAMIPPSPAHASDTMREVRLADFTTTPGPRYRRQGAHSAEEFRQRHLEPAVAIAHQHGEKLRVDLDGAHYRCPIGFLEEAFGSLVRTLGAKRVIPVLEIVCSEHPETVEQTEQLMADASRTRHE